MKICIFGAGAWGTASAIHCAKQHDVLLWARKPELINEIQNANANQRYLPGVALPNNLQLTSDFDKALTWVAQGSGVAILATPSGGLIDLLPDCINAQPLALLNLAKGLLPHESLPFQYVAKLQALTNVVDKVPFGSLFGPSFAQEVALGLPTALTAASIDLAARTAAIEAFHHDKVRVYGSEDAIGVELAGALKNVVAIAAGASDGLQLGNNARAALVTRGLAEIARIGLAMGGQAASFQGLSGLGDLLLTCTGPLSRNRQVGLRLAVGENLLEIQAALGHVAEGVRTAASAQQLTSKLGIDAPIIRTVYRLLFEGLPIAQAVSSLLERAQKDEL
jgi:glycerol-3-phosphate dehydrogenase (NAD(P)+)